MRMLKFILPAAALAVGFLGLSTTSQAKPAYSTKEHKPCTFCHVKAGSTELNADGKYYKLNKKIKPAPAPKA